MSANKLNIKISSSGQLDEKQKAALEAAIAGKLIRTRQEADPGSIGGMRMQVGDTVYDQTIRHFIDRFAEQEKGNLNNESGLSVADDVRKSIDAVRAQVDVYEIGHVISVGDGICKVSGLADVLAGEISSYVAG